jgi:hypothetical protein
MRLASSLAIFLASVSFWLSIPKTAAAGESERPGPGPGTYEILPKAARIQIPFEVVQDELRVTAELNGHPIRMLIDNGALWDQLLFFGSTRVDSLNMERDGRIDVGGAGSTGAVPAETASGISIRLTGANGRSLVFHDQDAVIMPYERGAPNPWAVAEGQFSAQFFKYFVVDFDFDTGLMTLTRPDAFRPDGAWHEVEITPVPGSASWSLPVALTLVDGRRLELNATMDLGWDEGLAVTTGQAHAVSPPPGLEKTLLGHGANGPIHGYLGTMPRVEIAGTVLREVPTTYASHPEGGSDVDEFLVGFEVLKRFRLVFDYPRHRLFLGPRRNSESTP